MYSRTRPDPGPFVLHRDHLHTIVGRGAHSVVYRVEHGDELYAVKVYAGSQAPQEALRQYRREAAVYAGLSHRAIPAVHEVGVLDGTPYIVSEYIEGQSLVEVLRTRTFTETEGVRLAALMAEALDMVHNQGLVHRDVKPKNILLSFTGDFRLIDFGLSAIGVSEARDEAVGTFLYSAPEQSGMLARPVDGRADLYSLGVVLFECLTGRPPFIAGDIGELLHQHAAVRPPRVDALVSEISYRFSEIIDQLLRKDPDDRPSSGLELLSLLDEVGLRRRSLSVATATERARARRQRVFVGRTVELEWLSEQARDLDHGRGAVALLEGAPGAGKSRLIEAFLDQPELAEAVVLAGRCTTDPYPFAPLRDALADLADSPVAQDDLREAAGESAPLLCQLAPDLGPLLDQPPDKDPGANAGELVHNAVRTFILGLSNGLRPVVLWLDDVQWLDQATREVLLLLAPEVEDHRLLILLTARNDAPSQEAVDHLRRVLRGALKWTTLEPLSALETRDLVHEELGYGLDAEFIDQLAVRSNGNPLTVRQYLDAMKEHGILAPSWGQWTLDVEGLADVPLPSNAFALMTTRLDRLTAKTRQILTAAAFLRGRFELAELVAICAPHSEVEVQMALGEATAARLVDADHAASHFTLVHDRVRDALLAEVDDPAAYHRRLATYLDGLPNPTERQLYHRAFHFREGFGAATPGQTRRACLDAAYCAVAQHAHDHAFELLCYVRDHLGGDADLTAEELSRYHEALGTAAFHADHADEAFEAFRVAQATARDPADQARLAASVARTAIFSFESNVARQQLEDAFGLLEYPLPSAAEPDPARLRAQLNALRGSAMEAVRTLRDYGTATPEEAPRLRAIIELCEVGTLVGYYERDPAFAMQCGLLALEPALKLGECGHACQGYSVGAFLMAQLGERGDADLLIGLAMNSARALNDPRILAVTQAGCATAAHLCGEPDEALRLQTEVFQRYGDWLDPNAFHNVCGDLLTNHLFRGHSRQEAAVARAALTSLGTRRNTFMGGHACRTTAAAMVAAATLGEISAAREHASTVRDFEQVVPAERPVPWVSVAGYRALYAVETDDLEVGLEAAIKAHAGWEIPPDRGPLHARHFYLAQVYGRLRQALRDPTPTTVQRYDGACEALRLAAGTSPLLQAHYGVAQANLLTLRGELDTAWALLDRVHWDICATDNPWALFEESCARARILLGHGRKPAAGHRIRQATEIAREAGWLPRLARLEEEFEQASPHADVQIRTRNRTQSVQQGGTHTQRQLDALISLSRASASVLEPAALARITLDESMHILGAERGYLFIVDEARGELVFTKGRSVDRRDLDQPSGYSRTVIDRVFQSREAVVMSSRSDADALAADSVIAFDLRSILAAPLMAGDTVLGVIYFDNRLAHGVFSEEHVEVLRALQSHIATAFQTARAAALHASLESETSRRQLAETLRDVTASLTQTLNVRESLERFADVLEETFDHDCALLALCGDGGPQVQVTRNLGPEASRPLLTQLGFDPDAEWTVGARATTQSADRGACLLLPLRTHQNAIGLAILVRRRGAFSPDEVQLGSALVGPAGIAIENAQLFTRIRRFAEYDALTGLLNRREFYRRAEETFIAVGHGTVAAVMFDVDHFKRFNDEHGHAVGDTVLAHVAQLAQSAVRDQDILGRYGGEEFIVVLPGASSDVVRVVGERIRTAIESSPLSGSEGQPLKVTVSVGATTRAEADDLDEMISRADAALYTSKARGRNLVTVV